jgi:hypothetical protein
VEPYPSQILPMHLGWPPAAQWHHDNNQFAGDMYVIGAPPFNWYPQVRYTRDPRVADPVYIDRDGFPVQQVERREMYEDPEYIRYARAPIQYVSSQPVAPPLLPASANPHPSTEPMRAPAHDKGHQPTEDVYSFESFVLESSATKNIPSAEDFGKVNKAGTVGAQTASTPADVPINTPPYSTHLPFLTSLI